jgi:hypothetical protein
MWKLIGPIIFVVAARILSPSEAYTQTSFGTPGLRTAQPLPTRISPGVGEHRGKLSWREGRWRHTARNGRLGWWWDVGGVWYYYPGPIDGPPSYVSDVEAIEEASSPPAAPQTRRAPPQTFYYSPGNLTGTPYPTVEECWQARDRAGGAGICIIK